MVEVEEEAVANIVQVGYQNGKGGRGVESVDGGDIGALIAELERIPGTINGDGNEGIREVRAVLAVGESKDAAD